jgi:hypothetical protein
VDRRRVSGAVVRAEGKGCVVVEGRGGTLVVVVCYVVVVVDMVEWQGREEGGEGRGGVDLAVLGVE